MNPHQLAWGFASGMPWAMMTFITTFLSPCHWDFYFTLLGLMTARDVYVLRAASGGHTAPACAGWTYNPALETAAR